MANFLIDKPLLLLSNARCKVQRTRLHGMLLGTSSIGFENTEVGATLRHYPDASLHSVRGVIHGALGTRKAFGVVLLA